MPAAASTGFQLFYDKGLTEPAPYNDQKDYFSKAQDRMDRTFDLIKDAVPNCRMVDIGASPFYLLFRAKAAGAAQCHGVYFANDEHPLKRLKTIHSRVGPIELEHADIEAERLPFEDDSVDVLTACEVLEHLEHFPFRLGSEIRRVLKPGALVCFTVPNVSAIGNIIKLICHRNIYYKYRADPTGWHKHEYTMSQLQSFARYLGLKVEKAGYMPSPTSHMKWLRPAYRFMAALPGIRSYSPVLYVVARNPTPKPAGPLGPPPRDLYDDALSIED